MRHRVCMTCGKYRGRLVIDVVKAAEMKQKKVAKKEKQETR